MGFLSKKGDGDDDSSRRALFGSRNKNKSSAKETQNPYAQPTIPADPYTQAKMSAGVAPSPKGPPGQGRPGLPSSPAPSGGRGSIGPPPQQGYGRGPSPSGHGDSRHVPTQQGGYGGGYGPEKFGNQNGYGAEKAGGNPYGNIPQTSGTSRQGGYGGLGRANSSESTSTDANRDALFGGARDRVQQRQQNNVNGPPGYEYNPQGVPEADRSYGAYGDRQLTAEEEEEEDIQATKSEIKFMKQQDVSSTRNAMQMAAQAEETGRNTLARLGAQGERIHNTERNLDLGSNHLNTAEDRSTELKTLNRSMFAVHVNNPFTGKDRRARRDDQIRDRHRMERDQREATREAAFQSSAKMNQNFKGLTDASRPPQTKASLAERGKYQFEADSDDDQMEDEIERNLDDMSGAVGRLNLLARATGEEVEAQNGQILRVAEKVCDFLLIFDCAPLTTLIYRAIASTTVCISRLRSSSAYINRVGTHVVYFVRYTNPSTYLIERG